MAEFYIYLFDVSSTFVFLITENKVKNNDKNVTVYQVCSL